MTANPIAPALVLFRLAFHRTLLWWVHAVLAAILALSCLSHLNLAGRHYWRRGFGIDMLVSTAPAWVPYIVSGFFAAKVVTYLRVRFWAFLAVILAGAVFQELVFLNVIQVELVWPRAVWMVLGLSAVYIAAAEVLMHDDQLD